MITIINCSFQWSNMTESSGWSIHLNEKTCKQKSGVCHQLKGTTIRRKMILLAFRVMERNCNNLQVSPHHNLKKSTKVSLPKWNSWVNTVSFTVLKKSRSKKKSAVTWTQNPKRRRKRCPSNSRRLPKVFPASMFTVRRTQIVKGRRKRLIWPYRSQTTTECQKTKMLYICRKTTSNLLSRNDIRRYHCGPSSPRQKW